MVDINLFKEEEGEEKEWDSTSDEGEELEDALQDEDLGLSDDDIADTSPIEEDDLLSDDDEVIPDFGETVDGDQEEDYEFGEVRQKKTSPWVFVALGVVVIAAAVYLFIIQPKEKAAQIASMPHVRRPAAMQTATQPTESQQTAPSTTQPDSSKTSTVPPAQSVAVSGGTGSGIAPVVGSTASFVRASRTIVDEFTKRNQFAAFIMSGNQFHVGYVSETPNVANAMSHKVGTLLSASDLKTSPEERHRTAGRIYYWGVVSGQIGAAGQPVSSESRTFTTTDGVVEGLKGVVQQHRLTTKEVQKLFEGSYEGKRQAQVRMKIEGNKADAMNFLNGLQNFNGNYGMTKLIIAPVTISDFQGNQVKLVLDFLVSFG